MKRKILIIELWGLGDLTFATPVISAALEQDEVHLLGKKHAKALLEPSFPKVRFIAYDAPWTVFRGKYKLWKWNWIALVTLMLRLRREKYDIAISARNDPRDHLFMGLIDAKRRIGFMLEGPKRFFDMGRVFLTNRLKRGKNKQHKVEDWHQIGATIDLPAASAARPQLDHARYRTERVDRFFANVKKPVICLHTGAGTVLRRWPESYFARIIGLLRNHFDFHLFIVPEPLTLPSSLAESADTFVTDLTVHELADVLGRADLLICNDSGPAHIAAACGRPVIAIFGPGDPDWFHPWGNACKIVLRDICPWRPCFDYCKFTEPYCLTKLLPETVWPDLQQHIRKLLAEGELPDALLKNTVPLTAANV